METAGKHVDRESEAFKTLKGVQKHFCPDWDYMAIDEHSPEFESCTCDWKHSYSDETSGSPK